MNTGQQMARAIMDTIIPVSDWPADAVFKAEYRYHTWPCGWDTTVYKKFFNDANELNIFLGEMEDWALSEDNKVAITVYEWDLGPEQHSVHNYG